MVRSILAVAVGLIVAMILFSAAQFLCWFIYLSPLGVNPMDPEAAKPYFADPPLGALLLVLLGYFVGTLCGTGLAVRIARRAPAVHALIVCGMLLIANLMNLLELPHPPWFWVATFVTFPVAAAAGALVGHSPAKPFAA
jgi:hypothetical protein